MILLFIQHSYFLGVSPQVSLQLYNIILASWYVMIRLVISLLLKVWIVPIYK